MKYSTHPANPPNLCLDCGDKVRRPKQFCDDRCDASFGSRTIIDQRGVEQVRVARKQLGVTADALEFRRKINVQRPF